MIASKQIGEIQRAVLLGSLAIWDAGCRSLSEWEIERRQS